MQRTLEFEQELAERFGEGSNSAGTDEDSDDDAPEGSEKDGELTASAIRKKYQKQLALKQVVIIHMCSVDLTNIRGALNFVCRKAFQLLCCLEIRDGYVTHNS